MIANIGDKILSVTAQNVVYVTNSLISLMGRHQVGHNIKIHKEKLLHLFSILNEVLFL